MSTVVAKTFIHAEESTGFLALEQKWPGVEKCLQSLYGHLKRIHEKTRNPPSAISHQRTFADDLFVKTKFFCSPCSSTEGGGVVGVGTSLLAGQSGAGNLLGQDILSSPKYRAQLWDSPSRRFSGYLGPFQGVQQPGAGPSSRAV